MKKLSLFIGTLLIAAIGTTNAQVLYKISGNGLKTESYIIGTEHAVKSSFVDSIPGAKRVLSQVQQVCGELVMKYANNTDTAMSLIQYVMLPPDSVARNIMTEAQFDTLCRVVKDNYNIDLNSPQFASLLRMYPMFLYLTIPQLSEQMKQMTTPSSTQNRNDYMDFYFQQEAEKAGKTVLGLETYSFQMKLITTLYDMPLKQQYAELIESLKNKKVDSQLKDLENTYKSLDLSKIEKMLDQIKESEDITTRILYSRNDNWADKMPSMMSEKSTLFVVGVGHLVGDKSILKLLRAKGYKIKAVEK